MSNKKIDWNDSDEEIAKYTGAPVATIKGLREKHERGRKSLEKLEKEDPLQYYKTMEIMNQIKKTLGGE